MDKICPDCGAKQPSINKFCESCGYTFVNENYGNFSQNQREKPQLPEDDKVYMFHPVTGEVKVCKTGYSWELLLQNFIYLLRNFNANLLLAYGFIVIVAAVISIFAAGYSAVDSFNGTDSVNYWIVPWGIAIIMHVCYSGAHNKRIISDLTKKGYEPCSENSKDYLIVNKLIQNEEGRLYPAKNFIDENKSKIGAVAIFLAVWGIILCGGLADFTDKFLVFASVVASLLGAYVAYSCNMDLRYEYKKI